MNRIDNPRSLIYAVLSIILAIFLFQLLGIISSFRNLQNLISIPRVFQIYISRWPQIYPVSVALPNGVVQHFAEAMILQRANYGIIGEVRAAMRS